jgi:hypothetical protein
VVVGLADALAVGVGAKVGVGVGTSVAITVGLGEGLVAISGENLDRSQTKYPAITTRIKIITTMVTLRFKINSPPKFSGQHQANLNSLFKKSQFVIFFSLLSIKSEANKPPEIPSKIPPITSENQCSPK